MGRIRLKKGDEVIVIRGELKGRKGAILEVDRQKGRVKVDGVSKGKKKTLKKSQQHPQGGLVDRVESIPVASVMLAARYTARRERREKAGKAGA